MSDSIKGTPPSTRKSQPAPAVEEAATVEPLSKSETSKLNFLGYKKADIAELTFEQARAIIANKAYRPGSAAHAKHAINPMTGTPGIPEIARFTDEAIEERNASRDTGVSAFVIADEFTHQCIRGEDPLDACLNAYAQANPGMRIRLINPDLPPTAGSQFQPISGAKPVGGLIPSFMPEAIYQEEFVNPNLKRSQTMAGENPREPGAVLESVGPEGAHLLPLEGKGLQIQQNLKSF